MRLEDTQGGGRVYCCTLCPKQGQLKHHILGHIENMHFPGCFVYSCQEYKLYFIMINCGYAPRGHFSGEGQSTPSLPSFNISYKKKK